MFWNQFKTAMLLAFLAGLLMLAGQTMGGSTGLNFALMMSVFMSFGSYFFADKMVLSMYGAKSLDVGKYGYVYEIVEELCQRAKIPVPKLYLIPSNMANAFATGRNPKNASVAVTDGILNLLDESELRGVLAHELSHIKNRDILVATVAATIAMAIGYLANMMKWSLIFGSSRRRDGESGFGAIIAMILMPFAAMLIQMAISRSREYLADESGAEISGAPLALASALEKIAAGPKLHTQSQAAMATETLFIANPFSTKNFFKLLSTHPPMEERIKRLHAMVK